jgi:Flp pilus assembly protein CpaB
MTYRVRNIVVAVVLAALAGALTLVYVVNYKRHVQHGEGKVNVLVAARDIPAGTTGSEVVEQHMLKTEAVPRRTLVPGWIGASSQLSDQVATQDIYAKEQVTTRRFAPPREQGIRSLLRGNERGMQVGGDPNQLLAGTLKDHDHVDVVGTWDTHDRRGHPVSVSRVILRNLLVLKAPEAVSATAKLGPSQDAFAQLRVTDAQSQKLKWIIELGEAKDGKRTWHLELRPPVKSTDSANTYQDDNSMLYDGPGRRP